MMEEDTAMAPESRRREPKVERKSAAGTKVEEALAAVVEEKGADSSPISLFGALLPFMEAVSDGSETNKEAALGSLVVLEKVMGEVSPAVLCQGYDIVSKRIQSITAAYYSDADFLPSAVKCIGALLSGQRAEQQWAKDSQRKAFLAVLGYTADKKRNVRINAENAVQRVFVTCTGSKVRRVLSQLVSRHASSTLASTSARDAGDCLLMMGMLQKVVAYMTFNEASALTDELLELPRLGHSQLTASAMRTVEALANGITEKEHCAYLRKVCAKVGAVKPSMEDIETAKAHVHAMSALVIGLHRLEGHTAIEAAKDFIELVMPNFECDKEPICIATRKCIDRVLVQCVDEAAVEEAESDTLHPFHRIAEVLASGLGYGYVTSWDLILKLISRLFQRTGEHADPLLTELIGTLGQLYESMTDRRYVDELNAAIIAAANAVGAERFLNVLPLNLEAGQEPPRPWLLSLLKNSMGNTKLSYFAQTLLPMTSHVHSMMQNHGSSGHQEQAQYYHTIFVQAWSLLPSICQKCTDTAESFPAMARHLGEAVKMPSISSVVCQSIYALIRQSKPSNSGDEGAVSMATAVNESQRQANIAAMAQFSQNFLPVFFDAYADAHAQESDARVHLENAIESYLSITSPPQVDSFLKTVVKKLLEATTEVSRNNQAEGDAMNVEEAGRLMLKRNMLTDLLVPFVPVVSTENLRLLFKVVRPQLGDEDSTLQKKSYKLLQHMCTSHPDYVATALLDLKEALADSALACSPISKKARLKCLGTIVPCLDASTINFLDGVVGEVVLCCKEVNTKTRDAAYDVLLAMAHQLVSIRGTSSSVTEVFQIVAAGMAGGTPHMISASIESLARLLYEFKEDVHPLVSELLMTVGMYLPHKSREIVKSVLGFTKVALTCLGPGEIQPYVETLAVGLTERVTEENRKHFRHKIRHIFERLVRRLGHDDVLEATPEAHRKLVVHIKKTKERNQRLAARGKTATDGSGKAQSEVPVASKKHQGFMDVLYGSEDEEEKPAGAAARRSRKEAQSRNSAWIREDRDDDDAPVDLLDSAAAEKVRTSNPNRNKKRRAEEFDTNPDGRLVIEEEEDPDEMEQRRRKRDIFERDEDDEIFAAGKKHSQKKQQHIVSRDDDGDAGRAKKRTRINTGSEYRSRKAGGDVKKVNKLEPFAYMPLEKGMANPKKLRGQRAKTASMQKLVKAAKKGSTRGAGLSRKQRVAARRHK